MWRAGRQVKETADYFQGIRGQGREWGVGRTLWGRGQEKYDWQLLGFESEPTPMAQVLQAHSLQYGTIL